MTAGYGADLARVHHEAFGFVARAAAPVVVDALRPGHDSGLVVDLGCGSGIMAAALTDAGYDVLGVDLSPDMVALATRTASRARFVVGSLFDVDIPPCVAVTAIGECVGYAFDRPADGSALRALAGRVQDALAPGGVFVLDVAGPGRAGPDGARDGVHEGDGWLVATRRREDAAAATLHRDIALFVRDGDCWRRTDEPHVLRLHDPDDVAATLRDAGFAAVDRRDRYGDLRLGHGWTAFVARKAPVPAHTREAPAPRKP